MIWRKQLLIATILIVLTAPIYFLDQYLLKPGTGNWINLDFRGLLFWTYVILILAHLFLSSLGLYFFKKQSLAFIHLMSGIFLFLILLGLFLAS